MTALTDQGLNLLNPQRVETLKVRKQELVEAICSLDLIGSAAEVSTGIGHFHLLRGKLDAIDEILTDHQEAIDALKLSQASYG